MKPRVQASPAIVDNARQKAERDMMIKHEIRATMIDNQRRFEEEMRIIYERVEARPLLIEQGEFTKNISNFLQREIKIRDWPIKQEEKCLNISMEKENQG